MPANDEGRVAKDHDIIRHGLNPTWMAAGVSTIEKGADGKVMINGAGEPVRRPEYTGSHALRHFYASWCINRKADNGLELPPKVVQERLGHATVSMTLDVYGHLFPGGDASAWMAAAEAALFE